MPSICRKRDDIVPSGTNIAVRACVTNRLVGVCSANKRLSGIVELSGANRAENQFNVFS